MNMLEQAIALGIFFEQKKSDPKKVHVAYIPGAGIAGALVAQGIRKLRKTVGEET